MADHFLGALKEIERRAQNNILVFSDVLSERLDVIAQSMISKPLSDNDYLKLAELYYKKFSKEKNKQGMLFCLLRMQQIVFLKEHTDKQTGDIKLELDTLAYVLLLMLFVLLFHIPFKVAFILLVLAWIVVLVYAKQKGVPYFYGSRIQTLSQEVDSTFLQVDQGIFTKVE